MYLGIDVGTSGVKAVLMDEQGQVTAQSTGPLSVARPHPLWSEQMPDDWCSATEQAVLGLPADLRASVKAIGLAGQMHGATLLGVDDKPLRPGILWNDGRSFEQCRALEQAEPRSREITGNLAMPGFTAPKLLWVRDNEPDVFAQIATVLLPKDYVRLWMTGEKASDMSDSAGTLWLDVAGRSWSEAMLAASGLDVGKMPSLFEGSEPTGSLSAPVAARWGMRQVFVAAGGGDNAAGAVGVGVIEEGDALLSLGTSGVTFVATAGFRPNPEQAVHAFCHAIPGTWHQMAVHLSAAICFDWAAAQLGLSSAADVLALAERSGSSKRGEVFLPFLSGERTPHNDPHIRAAWLGLSSDTDRGSLAAAVLEGVAFAHADGLDALRAAGTHVEELTVIGGGARSRYLGTILAAALGARLVYIDGGEVGPALGAAKLAQIAETGAKPSDVCCRPPVVHVIEPDPQLAEHLAGQRLRYRAAVSAIRAL